MFIVAILALRFIIKLRFPANIPISLDISYTFLFNSALLFSVIRVIYTAKDFEDEMNKLSTKACPKESSRIYNPEPVAAFNRPAGS